MQYEAASENEYDCATMQRVPIMSTANPWDQIRRSDRCALYCNVLKRAKQRMPVRIHNELITMYNDQGPDSI